MSFICRGQPKPGTASISADDLGTLQLADEFIVTRIDIGHPAERPNVRARARKSGVIDDSEYVGARAVTLSMRLNPRIGLGTREQELYDQFRKYLLPGCRSRLSWSLRGTQNAFRSVVVRCVDAPMTVENKLPPMVISFVTVDSQIDGNAKSEVVRRGSGTEDGRNYDLSFDRTYPAQVPVGTVEMSNFGTLPANWVATIFAGTGTVIDPELVIGDIDVTFDQNSGLTIPASQSVRISTQESTVLLNGDPTTPVYDRLNFLDWEWDDLLFRQGLTPVRFDHSGTSTDALVAFDWRDAWL